MQIEKIKRSKETSTRASNIMEHLIADEGKKLINQDYLDDPSGADCVICSEVYCATESSSLDWAEITEEEATKYQEEYNKKVEEKLKQETPSLYELINGTDSIKEDSAESKSE